jgi:hypothetical protein
MIISSKHRFVMLAPWKTASQTLHVRLDPYNDSPYSRFFYYNPFLQRVVHQHITYADYLALPESKNGYFTAAFVRNPYDRVYSGFVQLQRDMLDQPKALFPQPWIKALALRQIAENFEQLVAAEFDFNKWFGLVEEHQILEAGRNSNFPLHPAHYWTGINQQRDVDFVGKVETFEDDFLAFCRRVEIGPGDRLNANVSSGIADLESSQNSRYAKMMSRNTVSKINDLFSADFELFGYEKIRLR